jgi:hypothetical protein
VTVIGVRASNQNTVAERFVQSIRRECLDHIFERTLRRHLIANQFAELLRAAGA